MIGGKVRDVHDRHRSRVQFSRNGPSRSTTHGMAPHFSRAPVPCSLRASLFSQPRRALTMTPKIQRLKMQDGPPSTLNAAIDVVNLAKDNSDVAPAQAAFGSVGTLLTTIRVRCLQLYDNRLTAYVSLGLYTRRTWLHRSRAELRRYLRCP